MAVAPQHALKPGQYRLRALLAATAVAAVLLAIARWAGDHSEALHLAAHFPGSLPTEWALALEGIALTAMVAVAASRQRLGSLLLSKGTMVFIGGVSMLTCGFFRYSNVAWGGTSSFYESLARVPSGSWLPVMLAAWPMPYGAVLACVSYPAIVGSGTKLGAGNGQCVLSSSQRLRPLRRVLLSSPAHGGRIVGRAVLLICTSCCVLVALSLTAKFARAGQRKLHAVNLIAAIWLLPKLLAVPSTRTANLADILCSLEPGYWLLALGEVLITVGSLSILLATQVSNGSVKSRAET